MKKEVLWNISITSRAERKNLTNEEIDYIMTLFNDPEYRVEYNSIKESVRNTFPDSKVAIWQCDKGVEIDKLFEDNLQYDISEDEVNIVCDYSVYLGKNFDEGDVMTWATGLHHLVQILPRIAINNIKECYANNQEFNENPYKIYQTFLQDISHNQIMNVTKI